MSKTNPLQIDTFIDVDQFTTEINEDISDLTEAMRTQTARCAYYGFKHVEAKSQQKAVDRIVKATEAKLKVEHRKLLTAAALEEVEGTNDKPMRITADIVDAAVHTDLRMLKLLGIQQDADEVEMVCRVAVDAFRTRQQMLISLGHLTRDQMKTNLQIAGTTAKNAVAGYADRRAKREATDQDA